MTDETKGLVERAKALYAAEARIPAVEYRLRALVRELVAALEAAEAENARLRESLRRIGENEWIVAPWYDEQSRNFTWRVNVATSDDGHTHQYFAGTAFIGATPADACLAAL